MTGRSHLLLTGAAYLALALRPLPTPLGVLAAPRPSGPLLDQPLVAYVVGGLIALSVSLAPDADKAGSKAARSGGRSTRAAAWAVQLALGHRGALHSLLAVVACWWVGALLGDALGISGLGGTIAFGWGAHVVIDACTRGGVPLLWPLPTRLRLPPGLVTGTLLEHLLVAAALLLAGWWALGGDIKNT